MHPLTQFLLDYPPVALTSETSGFGNIQTQKAFIPVPSQHSVLDCVTAVCSLWLWRDCALAYFSWISGVLHFAYRRYSSLLSPSLLLSPFILLKASSTMHIHTVTVVPTPMWYCKFRCGANCGTRHTGRFILLCSLFPLPHSLVQPSIDLSC